MTTSPTIIATRINSGLRYFHVKRYWLWSRPVNFDLSLNQLKSIKWSSNIAISYRATPVVVEHLRKLYPLESLHLHRYFNKIT